MMMFQDISFQIKKFGNVQNLMKYFSMDSLVTNHNLLIRREIRSINRGINTDRYDIQKVNSRIEEINLSLSELSYLCDDIAMHNYFPTPVRRCFIPKSNNGMRPLGIPAYKDKIVQSIFTDILTSIYEPEFYNCSFAYRRNKSCHTALLNFNKVIKYGNTKYIVKIDIKGFFDNINHEKLIDFLQYRIKDKYFIMYINRFLKAGILYNGKFINTDSGAPQGGLISPILANVFLHYVLDDWFEKEIKPLCNSSEMFRYADDIIACFTSVDDAKFFYSSIKKRLSKYNLLLAPNKSKIIPFSKYKDNFNFLGFNISITSQNNLSFRVSKGKSVNKQEKIARSIYANIHLPIVEQIESINKLLNNYYNYYKFETNSLFLYQIYYCAIDTLLEALCYNHNTMTIDENTFWSILDSYPILLPPKYLIHL